ncbi:GIY-YIG nuclease family protein [Bacillus sp. UNC438CL73TsuS30]|uniref:GIY-YIG nuclease family protein n=1 Tax=Bacillus sp. UNC438CL73TsuS30 TaxID=1340434 RepID=UPI002F35FA69
MEIVILKDKIKCLPTSPGVYLMKDSHGNIIYVGKAKNLKRRVQSYFQNSKAHSQKIVKLKNNIKDLDYILTDTEFEAFMLECHLIKETKPFFNRKMKNPRSYTYIVIKTDKKVPNIDVTNNLIFNQKHLYFGPYINKYTVEKAISNLKEFKKILCTNLTKRNAPCLNYSLGLCNGICLGHPTGLEQYNNSINDIIALLNSTDLSILGEMNEKMVQASEIFDFEMASKYRDFIDSINFILNKEKVIEFTEANKNIAVIEYLQDRTLKLFLIKGNRVLYSDKYCFASLIELCPLIKKDILTYFQKGDSDESHKISKDEIDEAQIIYSYLKSSTSKHLIIPGYWLNSENDALDREIKKLLMGDES